MGHWNFRILAKKHSNGVITYAIHEVHYDDKEKPVSYSDDPRTLDSDEMKGLKWTLNKMKDAFKKPVLSIEKFPEEFKTDQK